MRTLNNDVSNMSISDQYVSSGLDLVGNSSCIVSSDSFHCRSFSVEFSAMKLVPCPSSLFGGAILLALLKDDSNEHTSLFVCSSLESVS